MEQTLTCYRANTQTRQLANALTRLCAIVLTRYRANTKYNQKMLLPITLLQHPTKFATFDRTSC